MLEIILQLLEYRNVVTQNIAFKVMDVPHRFNIMHNLTQDEVHAAFTNWTARTSDFSGQSFCDYINSKRERGMTDHICLLTEDVEKELKLSPGEIKDKMGS